MIMCKMYSLPMVKRKMVCTVMGIGFGFICAYLASKGSPEIPADPNFWGSALMWSIVFNRFLIGMFIFIAGAFAIHPFGFRLYPWFRGLMMGAFVSIGVAIGVYMSPVVPADMMCKIFWMTIISGGIYGMIIDVVATKIAGDGEKLLKVCE